MNKIMTSMVAVGMVALSVSPLQAQGVGTLTMVVDCDTGDTIQDAVDKSREDTDIKVSGACNETVFIDKDRINLIGQIGATLSAPAGSGSVVSVRGSNVQIRNFEINAAGVVNGIQVQRGGTALIANNDIRNSDRRGIVIENAAYADISDNKISDNTGPGILLFAGSTAQMTRNEIEDNGSSGIHAGDGSYTRKLVMG